MFVVTPLPTKPFWGDAFSKFKAWFQAARRIQSKYEGRYVDSYGHKTPEKLTRNSGIFFLGFPHEGG